MLGADGRAAIEDAGTVGDGSRDLADEARSLERGTRLGALHWSIVAASVLITLAAWHQARSFVDERSAARFERERSQAIELVLERLARYEDALRAGVATYESHGLRVSHAEWREFAGTLDIEGQYPGIAGLGVVTPVEHDALEGLVAEQRRVRPSFSVHPPIEAEVHLPIVYIEPEARNRAAVGLDLAHERYRREAAAAARDSGEARITGPITLVQDENRTPGFLFMLPFYDRATTGTVAERREAFAGLVYAPFIVTELMNGALARARRHVSIRIRDDDRTIYDEFVDTAPERDTAPLFSDTTVLELYGRRWRFDVHSDLTFRSETGFGMTHAVLASGLFVDSALLAMFLLLTNSNRRALAYARRAADHVNESMVSLTRSNAELESFAHVVSHDLKTPLRGMGDLVEYLGEDLEPWLAANEVPADVERNLARLDVQQRRMSELIDGILVYSALGREQIAAEEVDLAAMLEDIAAEFGLDEHRLSCSGMPDSTLRTQGTRLRQVLHNLIANAIKHHDDPDRLRITVDVTRIAAGVRLSVTDNGPGIDPAYHDSVFEVFKKLRSKDEVEGSGVGLSIVARSVRIVGGEVRLESVPGAGARFTIDWPCEASDQAQTTDAADRQEAA